MYTPDEKRYEKMIYNRCGESGLKLPCLSLGLWHNFGDTGVYSNMKKMCETAFDNGITHFDLANNYGPEPGSGERNFGQILKDSFSGYRDEIIISTKAGYDMWPGPYGDFGSRKYLIASIDQSLKRMGVEYVDIFYHHRMDNGTPLEETMGALADIVRSGKALYVGLSNYTGERMIQASKILKDMKVPFIINQNRYNIFDRGIEENGLYEACKEEKKGIICFSPLAQGLLTDRYLNGIPDDSRIKKDGRFLNEASLTDDMLSKIKALNNLAEKRSESLSSMAIKWLLQHEVITSVIIGASKPEQILKNVEVLDSPKISDEDMKAIDMIVMDTKEQ
ncbi:MAG: aldo/keto reductase [Eubacterium sp.]|nr:aldo/keto reductase [Eubacterium sp.]